MTEPELQGKVLQEKVAIVTGGGSGIGAAICRDFARHGVAGVVVVGHSGDDRANRLCTELAEMGSGAVSVTGDIADPVTSETMVGAAVEEFGRLDILVSNAGAVSQSPLVEMTDEEWDRMLRVDLYGAFYGARAAAKRMINQHDGGRIINTSSIMAWQTRAGQSAYAAAKAGILAMSRALAIELGRHQITVNNVLPGHVSTPLTEPMFTPEVTRAFNERIPLGRLGEPDSIAGAYTFLASPAADYITGQSLLVDGGFMISGTLPGVEFGPSGTQ